MAQVEWRIDGAVRRVLLNRPEKRNALDAGMLEALTAAFAEPPRETERAAVIRGAGPVFCAGLDLRARVEMGTNPIERMLHTLETYPLPVVAVVQGDAIAGGNELALHCDLVIASRTAQFGMSLAQIGLVPNWFLAKKLLEAAGPMVTRKILFLGDPLPASRLYELGIVSHLVEPDRLDAAAEEVLARLVANAPLSLKAMKQLLLREMKFRDGIPHEDIDRFLAEVRQSADAKEGMAARLEKRPARFQGR
ncbi:MAG: enoyl-CoA hydratase/isomerase family protein [Stellaceae bacterium]